MRQWTIVALLALWWYGFMFTHVFGLYIHVLLVGAVILLLFHLSRARGVR